MFSGAFDSTAENVARTWSGSRQAVVASPGAAVEVLQPDLAARHEP